MPPPEPRAAAPVIAPQFLPENQPGAARAAAPQFNADGRPVQLCDARGSALAPRAILQPQAASVTGAEDALAHAKLTADVSMSDAAHADEDADYVPFTCLFGQAVSCKAGQQVWVSLQLPLVLLQLRIRT